MHTSDLLYVQEWLVNEKQLDVFGMKLPTGFQLIGQVVCAFIILQIHLNHFIFIFTWFCILQNYLKTKLHSVI